MVTARVLDLPYSVPSLLSFIFLPFMSVPESLKNQNKWTAPVIMKGGEVHCASTCVQLGPLFTDGDSKLIVTNGGFRGMNTKLKVYQGIEPHSESLLADMPTAIVHFVNELSSIPSIAVAAGPSLLIYKNLKPFYKFTVPSSPINHTEQEAWKAVAAKKINTDALHSILSRLSDEISFAKLTPMSQTYILCDSEDRMALIERFGAKIVNSATITCMSKMIKSSADRIDVLVVGTEHCELFMVDSQAFTVLGSAKLNSVPVSMCTYGSFDVDYRIFVQTRDSLIYCVKRDETEHKAIIVSQSMITSLTLMNKTIVYSTAENLISFNNFKGKKINTVKCESKVKMLEPFYYSQKQLSAVIAVFDKEIRMYNESYLLDVQKYEKSLSWVKFGCYGREDSTLITSFKDGSIAVQIFRRTANFNTRMDFNQMPPSHAIKLQIPKKTKIFIDQTNRELEFSKKIHQTYQKELFNLRYKVAEVYQQLTESASATVSTTPALPVDIAVDINGFGPNFRMTIHLLSTSKQNLYNMYMSIISDPELYEFETPLMPVSFLASGQSYTFTTLLLCKDPEKAANSEIRALLIHSKRATPIVTAVIKMPFSEFPID